jgi:hypothetical protein
MKVELSLTLGQARVLLLVCYEHAKGIARLVDDGLQRRALLMRRERQRAKLCRRVRPGAWECVRGKGHLGKCLFARK